MSYVVHRRASGRGGGISAPCGICRSGRVCPLTGFGNTLAKGVKEAVQEDGFLGIFTGGLKASAGGITAAILSGLIASLIFKAKDKS